MFVLHPYHTSSHPLSVVSSCSAAARKNWDTSWERQGGRDEEMKRREVKGESRKLNHQLTGFVETQLAGGTEGDGGRGGGGGGRRWAPGSHKQTINTVTPEGRNRKMRMWQEFWYPALTLTAAAKHSNASNLHIRVHTHVSVSARSHFHKGARGAALLCSRTLTCRITVICCD